MSWLTGLFGNLADHLRLGKGPKWAKSIDVYYREEIVMALTIEDMQKVLLTAKGRSAAGNPTDDLAEPLTWASSDPNIIGLGTPAFPSCYANAQGPLGGSKITVSGTNAKGDTITGEIDIAVKAGPTVGILVEAGVPEAL